MAKVKSRNLREFSMYGISGMTDDSVIDTLQSFFDNCKKDLVPDGFSLCSTNVYYGRTGRPYYIDENSLAVVVVSDRDETEKERQKRIVRNTKIKDAKKKRAYEVERRERNLLDKLKKKYATDFPPAR